ncbi:MAG: DUF4386 domain-containing protein [Acidimicrobiia bacterium]
MQDARRAAPSASVSGGMDAERRSAVWVGVLWITATAFPAASAVPWAALDRDRGILVNAATHKGDLIAWLLLNVVEVLSAAGVAVMLYPILARAADTSVQKGMAVWYLGSRIAESGIYTVAIVATWAFLPLSRAFAASGSPDASHFQTTGELLKTTQDLGLALAQTVFAVGAAMMYTLLIRSRLVPRWLSLWGLIAAPLFVIGSLSLLWTGNPNSALANVCFAPMGLQEMVIAMWLIVKGFNPAALAKRSGADEGALEIATR